MIPITNWRSLVPPIDRWLRFKPRLEIAEDDDVYTLLLDVPGVREEDLYVRLAGHSTLLISGSRARHGSFTRTIELPLTIDSWRMTKQLHDGVLEICFPKLASRRHSVS